MKYDYLIVGSGLFGATFAHLATKQGKRCLVIDKRSHLGGRLAEYKYYDMAPIIEKVMSGFTNHS